MTFAQTQTEFVGRIVDLFELLIEHLLPVDQEQRFKSHGTKF